MLKNEKITKWEEEIARLVAAQKEYNQRCNDRVRELKRKVQEEEKLLVLDNNRMIADAVRAVYGEVSEQNIQTFMEQMKELAIVHEPDEPEADGQTE